MGVMTINPVLVQILRGFDGILYAFTAMFLLLFHPSFGRNELGNMDISCVLPVLVIGWFSYRIPPQFSDIKDWDKIVFNLRICSASFVLLSPFLIWWYSAPINTYLLINSQLAVIFGIGMLFQLNWLILVLAQYIGEKVIERAVLMANLLILYLLLVPFLAFVVTYIVDSYISSVTSFEDFYMLVRYLPPWLRSILIIPIIFCFFVLFRARNALVKHVEVEDKPRSIEPGATQTKSTPM